MYFDWLQFVAVFYGLLNMLWGTGLLVAQFLVLFVPFALLMRGMYEFIGL